ncbi:MAG: hypothetical protein K0R63_1151 [Rickettsiales bacterium]|jgi:starvation-inducible outer membrane lipoprotein|nr:hypothetical protein [Rickettsiales bacterium]
MSLSMNKIAAAALMGVISLGLAACEQTPNDLNIKMQRNELSVKNGCGSHDDKSEKKPKHKHKHKKHKHHDNDDRD